MARQIALSDIVGLKQQLPHWRRARARVTSGTAEGRIAFIGDSTVLGLYASGENTSANSRAKSYPSSVRRWLNPHVPSQTDSVWGSGFFATKAEYTTYDPRLVFGAGWTLSQLSLGGEAFSANAAGAGSLTFTPGGNFDTVDYYYVDVANGTTFTVDVGAAVLATIAMTGTYTLKKATLATAVATAVNFKWASGPTTEAVYIVGIETRTAATAAMSICNMGWAGSYAQDWAGEGTPFAPYPALQVVAPDLTVINLTINNWVFQPVTLSEYQTQMQKIIDGAKLSGDVILMVGVPSNASVAPLAQQATYAAAMRALAQSNDCPLIDVTARFGSFADANALGFYFDNVHPGAIGYEDIGAAVAQVLLAA